MSNQIYLKTVNSKHPNTGTVFFFHGSGDTGPGISEWLKLLVGDFSLPHIKFVFPTAPLMKYTPLNGELSHVWFDRLNISPHVSEHKESLDSMGQQISKLIQGEVESGVPLNKIIIGGFSMGGCLALHTAYRFVPGVAGVFVLSSFLNDNSDVYKKLENSTDDDLPPLFMCHGERDTLVPMHWGKNTFNNLLELNVKGEFVSIKNTLHEMRTSEIEQLMEWILKVLPS